MKQSAVPRRPHFWIALVYLAAVALLNGRYHLTPWATEFDNFFFFIGHGGTAWDWSRPPLYLMLGRAVLPFFENGLRAGQAVSLFSMAAVVYLTGQLAVRLTGRPEAGWTAALLVAVNEATLYFGMMCITDPLATALVVGGFLALFAVPGAETPVPAAFSGTLMALAYMTRYQTAVFWAGAVVALAVLIGTKKTPRAAFLWHILGAITALVPVLAYSGLVLDGSPLGVLTEPFRHPDARRLLSDPAAALRGLPAMERYRFGAVQFFHMAGTLAVLYAVVEIARRVRGERFSFAWQVLVWTGAAYFVSVGWMSHAETGFAESRRFFLPMLPVTMAFAAGLVSAPKSRIVRGGLLVAALVFAATQAGQMAASRFDACPPPEKAVADRIRGIAGVDRPAVIGNASEMALFFDGFEYCVFHADSREVPLHCPYAAGELPPHDLLVIREDRITDVSVPSGEAARLIETHPWLGSYELAFKAGVIRVFRAPRGGG